MKNRNRYTTVLFFFLYLLIGIICFPGTAFPQADSLKDLLRKAISDTSLIRLYYETGYAEYYDYNYDSAIVYYTKALELSEKTGDEIFEAKTHYSFGEMYLETGDFDLALEHYFEAIDFYIQDGYSEELINAYFGAGLAYKSKGFFKVAISYYNLSLAQIEESGDSLAMADIFNNLGTTEKNLGLYPDAMAHLTTALDIYTKEGVKVYQFNVLNNIGSLLEKQGENKRALEYYEKSLLLARETGDKYYMFVPLANTASMYSILKDYDKAFALFKEALELAGEINDNVRIADCFIELGSLMRKTGKVAEAQDYYNKAYDIAKRNGIKPTQTMALLNLSKLSLGEQHYIEAKSLAGEALDLALKQQAKPLIAESYYALYKIALEEENYNEALTYHQNWVAVQDSLYSIEKTKAIEELEVQYQVKTKVEENNRLKSEAMAMKQILSQRKRANILLSVGILLSMVIVALLIKQVRDHKKLQEKDKAIHQQKTQILNNKIEHQQRELVSKSISIAEKNSTLERIIRQLEEIKHSEESNVNVDRALRPIINELKFELGHKKHWKEFEMHFNSVHPKFYKNLNNHYPGLTVNDRKLSAFLKLKLTSKDISAITGQSLKSIEVARSRLRKKLNLERDDNLFELIERI